MTIVGLSRTARLLASTVLDIHHALFFVRRAELSPLSIQAVGWLSGALIVLTSAPWSNNDKAKHDNDLTMILDKFRCMGEYRSRGEHPSHAVRRRSIATYEIAPHFATNVEGSKEQITTHTFSFLSAMTVRQ